MQDSESTQDQSVGENIRDTASAMLESL